MRTREPFSGQRTVRRPEGQAAEWRAEDLTVAEQPRRRCRDLPVRPGDRLATLVAMGVCSLQLLACISRVSLRSH